MKRRCVISTAGCAMLGAAMPVFAQSSPRVYWVGTLARAFSSGRGSGTYLCVEALSQLGYAVGRNLVVEYRFAEGQEDRLDRLAADLVAKRVDAIVANSNQETLAAKRATKTIPIVMLFSFVPVELGLVESLARPGANVTGTTTITPETTGKTLQVLHDTVPKARRVAVLVETNFPGFQIGIQFVQRAAAALGIQVMTLPVNSDEELDRAFAGIVQDRPGALWVAISGALSRNRARIIEFAERERMPAMYSEKFVVIEGGLISYTFNTDDLLRRAASITDRILKGASPADVPVEQPYRFDLAINKKSARAIGLSIPQSVLLQATEVIE